MVLFSVEYEVLQSGITFICKVIGTDEQDVVKDLILQVGQIRIVSIYRVSDIHRISGTIRKRIIENYLMKDEQRSRVGRPRKYDL
ncbi:MAG: hypothetical protein FD159_1086 [Syntrophaceae bacterium]|nr:MAG: hypothetical protein FD159_1086 [Syntrophaceae bacterium]